MRIANYLRPECVALHQRADSLEGAVQQLVALLDGTENLTDTAAFAADVRARLALGGVCVGNGLAIPHAKSASVKRLQLAALTLDPPLACDTPDGKPLQMLVMIAAPAEANDLHVQVLAELATLFLDTDFCTHLRESTTPEAFCRAVAEREAQDDPAAPPPQTTDEPGYRLLGVTACPTGIAHTYLAAEALQRAAQTRGFSIKVETNGADGVGDALTEEDIRAADCIIVAADRAVSMARFVGKRLVYASAGDAVRDADALLEKAVSGKAPIYHGGHAFRTSDLRELGREGYGHLMNGVSHMIPVVVAGGVITALSLLSQQLGLPASWTMMMKNVGSAAFVMMYPVLAAFIASSIGDRPAFMPGLLGGSRLLLGALLGGMMATDYGGPINKAAYVSGTLALVTLQYDLMAAVMAGGMVPPLGLALACMLFPTRFTASERRSVPQTAIMGLSFVTEGALPFALRDPLRVGPSCIAGSALAGFLAIFLGCGCPAPHGGLFLLPVMGNPLGFLGALLGGSLLAALLLGLLKKPLKQ